MGYRPGKALAKLAKSIFSDEPISRRELMAGTTEAIGAAGLVAGGVYGTSRLFSDEFSGIPGVAGVDRYETPGAKYTLVHIRQMHGKPDMTEEELAQVKEVQDDIYTILDYMDREMDLEEVYVEDISPPTARELNAFSKSEIGRAVLSRNRILSRTAHGRMLAEGRIEIRPTQKSYKDPIEALQKAVEDRGKALFTGREETALEMVYEGGKPVSVMIYGALHTWKDDIEKWNTEHPVEMFSLVEITPESLVKYEGI